MITQQYKMNPSDRVYQKEAEIEVATSVLDTRTQQDFIDNGWEFLYIIYDRYYRDHATLGRYYIRQQITMNTEQVDVQNVWSDEEMQAWGWVTQGYRNENHSTDTSAPCPTE
jgi:hypothetical protein